MKKILRIVFYSYLILATFVRPKACDITIQSKWENLETPRETKLFGSQWILAATITFKKTPEIKEPIFINKLQFSWQGPQLTNLSASLYKKSSNQKFLPIEEALVCDGKWNNTNQELSFIFNEESRLDPVTRFYIVITIPEAIASQLQQGRFNLIQGCLPEELQEDLNGHFVQSDEAMVAGLSFTIQPTNSLVRHSRIA